MANTDPDDIDDLLNQIESGKTSTNKPSISTPTKSSQPPKTAPPSTDNSDLDDIDGLLQEIGSFTPPPQRVAQKKPTSTTPSPLSVSIPKTTKSEEITTPTQGGAKRRCQPACIGGSPTPKGCTSSIVDQKSCDKLRCTNCDFKIVSFNDNVWKDSVDILFFRNYIFDESKLKAVLNRKPGFCAYACQCAWKSVDSVQTISYGSGLKWACGGH